MDIQVKICGITRPEDAALVAELGATHLSCVMTPESPWYVPPSDLREIQHAAGKKVRIVLAFRSTPIETVMDVSKQTGIKHVQIASYKEADAQAMEKAGLTVYRTHEVPTGANMLPPLLPEPSDKAPAILQVSVTGTGLTFPWEILGAEAPKGTFIAGGVRPENICALLTHRPWGVALNTGIEREPGVKDPDRLALFFETLQAEASMEEKPKRGPRGSLRPKVDD